MSARCVTINSSLYPRDTKRMGAGGRDIQMDRVRWMKGIRDEMAERRVKGEAMDWDLNHVNVVNTPANTWISQRYCLSCGRFTNYTYKAYVTELYARTNCYL